MAHELAARVTCELTGNFYKISLKRFPRLRPGKSLCLTLGDEGMLC
jgi:hypothetical protein